MAEPLGSRIDELAEELAGRLSASVSHFVLSGSTGVGSWNRMMLRSLREPLTNFLVEDVNGMLVERGLEPIGRERASILVRDALRSTSDIRSRILTAPDPDGIMAAGRYSLGALVGRTHQLGIVQSLIRLLTGRATELSGVGGDGYTGRKRWRVSDPAVSRHADLDFVEAFNGKWVVAPGVLFEYPRQDPTLAAVSSNCHCYTEYLYVLPNGEEQWL